jgi:hypothetical protein
LNVTSAAEAAARVSAQGGPSAVVGFAVADLDRLRGMDLLVLADHANPVMVLDDRLLRFRRQALPASVVPPGLWNGALVFDADRDGRADLLLIGPDRPPLVLFNRAAPGKLDPATWWEPQPPSGPPLLQAQAIDLDLDGWTDIVGLSAEHRPVFLHNNGPHLSVEPLGDNGDWPANLVALTVADFDGDGFPDFVLWSATAGLELRRNLGNGNHALVLDLTGRRGVSNNGKMRCTADAFGVQVMVHADELRTCAEQTTLSAGLGQSRQPLMLGLARHAQADVIRLRWPDSTWQAELHQPTGQLLAIEENNRRPGSCPILFTWDGERFVFVADFLGAGSLGEMQPDGGYMQPRPEESLKIDAHQLRPRDGKYLLKIAEPMDEITYLDRLQLIVLDHPADVRVYPDERFTSSGPPASQEILALGQPIFPRHARDHHGRDVTRALTEWDRHTVDGFARRSWLGFAEEHWVELDFGDRLSKLGPKDPLVLCLAGWTDYPYPDSIWAATQAGVSVQSPCLERLEADGRWRTLVADTGFPAGLPRLMTLDVTGLLAGPHCVVRLRTNLEIFWDQIFVAPLLESVRPAALGLVRAQVLEVDSAMLSARGCMQEYSPDGRAPSLYDYYTLEAVPVSRLAGRLTRYGDVAELLRSTDDRFVIFGPGDELTVQFDARRLPPLPPGQSRSFVLRTWGYCKDASPFTATGTTVEPLPFRAMRTYPYGPDQHYPRDRVHDDYQRRFNTRQVRSRHHE